MGNASRGELSAARDRRAYWQTPAGQLPLQHSPSAPHESPSPLQQTPPEQTSCAQHWFDAVHALVEHPAWAASASASAEPPESSDPSGATDPSGSPDPSVLVDPSPAAAPSDAVVPPAPAAPPL